MANRVFVYLDQNESFSTEFAVGDTASLGMLTLTGAGGVAINAGGFLINNVATPVVSTDAVNKAYVDNLSQGISWKNFVRVATAAALPANTYANGTSGVGATLTATSNGVLTVDGVATVLGDRILVKNEATAANDGIYVVTTAGAVGTPYVLTRTTDANTGTELVAAAVFADEGTTNADSAFIQTAIAPITVGTTAQVWTQFTSTTATTASHGLQKVANDIQVKPGDGIDIVSNSASTNVALDATAPGLLFTGTAGSGKLAAKANTSAGIAITASGIGVTLGTTNPGLQFATGGVAILNSATGGLTSLAGGESLLLADTSLTLSGSGVAVASAPKANKVEFATYNANGAIAAKSAVYFSTNNLLDAAGTTTAKAHVVGVTIAGASASAACDVITSGVAVGILTGATVNTEYFVTSTGTLQANATSLPSGSRIISVGFALNATDLFVIIKDKGQRQ